VSRSVLGRLDPIEFRLEVGQQRRRAWTRQAAIRCLSRFWAGTELNADRRAYQVGHD
jgi:hypothetical protein